MTNPPEPRPLPDAELVRVLCQQARELVQYLERGSVLRLAIQAGDYRIEIERGQPVGAGGPPATGESAEPGPAPETDGRHPIVAPLVGTFYRAPQPGAPPFVEPGAVVDAGQTVAIVEAMKIMNHIVADQAGRVAEILVQDGEWVEFEQVLMYLEPTVD
jgi:acetyl-CoA carboxylase biotin carboxyl carrier protein